MPLKRRPAFPTVGNFIIKIHRDARPRDGVLFGRIEHVVSGDDHFFGCADEMIAHLVRHLPAEKPTEIDEVER